MTDEGTPDVQTSNDEGVDKGLLIQGAIVGGIVLLVLMAAFFGAF